MQNQSFKDTELSIVIPAFNEEKNIVLIYEEIIRTLLPLSLKSLEIIFVNDGSQDKTGEEIKKLTQLDHQVKLISLSRNFGHQNAILAGYKHSSFEYTVTLDADLQHPVTLIPKMLQIVLHNNTDIVITKRIDHSFDVKIFCAKLFYKCIGLISDFQILPGTADFRLLNRKALNALLEFKEYNLFYRGLINLIGFNQEILEYIPNKRNHGQSKYNLKRQIQFAIDCVTSTSTLPIRISTFLGIFFSLISFLYLIYALYMKLILNVAVTGWTSLIICILFIGGVQLTMLGIIGEYLGKIFFEVKNRPSYLISETVNLVCSNATSTHKDR